MPLPKLDQFPQPPADACFTLSSVQERTDPHPFMIGPKHVAFAADHCGGILGEAALKSSRCMHGGYARACNLRYAEHENLTLLFILVPQNTDLNDVPGLHDYLLKIKEPAEALGITGFAFPTIASEVVA